MKYYKVLIEIPAENEEDLDEALDCMKKEHPFEKEWWCECGDNKK
ncbi:MAG: hypothetical protein ACTSVV_03940 [Promethearchaeota archaeon]